MNATVRLFILDEVTLGPLLWAALRRRPVLILHVWPMLPFLAGALGRIAAALVAGGRARWAVDEVPEWLPHWRYDRRFMFQAVFERYEAWQNRCFGFDGVEPGTCGYGYGYKQVTSNHLFKLVAAAHVLDAVLRQNPGVRAVGASPVLLGLCREMLGADAAPGAMAAWRPRLLVNGLITALLMLAGSVSILRRCRWSPPSQPVFMAADCINDTREIPFYHEMAEAGPLLLVHRNQDEFGADSRLSAFASATLADGRLAPFQAVIALIELWRDTPALLFRHGGSVEPDLFWVIAAMPRRRLEIRALLLRYRPRYFWGRDDYNVEHILRRGEMHRIGGQSLGVSHAMNTVYCSLYPQWRYISFDRYYLIAEPLCHPYLNTWAGDMTIVNTGGFGWTRDDFRRQWPEGEAILVALRVGWWEPEAARAVQALAEAFPHRRVLLQFKRIYLSAEEEKALLAFLTGGHPNIEYVTDDIYALLRRARYLISDVSTLIEEAIEVGLRTFLLDVIDLVHTGYREVPGLCVRTADDLVSRIRAIEAGDAPYVDHGQLDAMGLRGRPIFYDLVGGDVGLGVKDPDLSYGGASRRAEQVGSGPARS